jgi:hypothetical protein
MISLKEAVRKATAFVKDIYSDKQIHDLLLEEVDTHGRKPVALAEEVCIYLEGCMPSNSL